MKYPLLWKTGVIIILSLLLLIPLGMVESIIKDRVSYRDQAKNSVTNSWASQQKLIGPLLAVRYQTKNGFRKFNKETGKYQEIDNMIDHTAWFSPSTLNVNANANVTKRYRGIFPVPVYAATVTMSGNFDTDAVSEFSKGIENFHSWGNASLVIGVNDTRGLKNYPKMQWNRIPVSFSVMDDRWIDLSGVQAAIGSFESASQKTDFEVTLDLRGMDDIQIVPVAEQNKITLTSDWPHPLFGGNYPPDSHDISASGFRAVWHQTSLSTAINKSLKKCFQGNCQHLQKNTLGVSFVEPVDIYRQSMRSAKYGILIITLAFLSFFLIEILNSIRIHPMQYLLVGVSLCLFFLVLLATGEILSFALSYCLAAASSISLIGYYLKHVLASIKISIQFCCGLAAVFLALYVIIQAENYALLMGSALLTAMVATTIVLTRKTDWYDIDTRLSKARKAGMAASGVVEAGRERSDVDRSDMVESTTTPASTPDPQN